MTTESIDFDQDFDDAFNEAASELGLGEDSQKAPDTTKEEEVVETEDTSEKSESAENGRSEEKSEDSDDEDNETVDLGAQYAQTLSQLKLANSRLEQLSGQYQATKGELKAIKEMTDTQQKKAKAEFTEPESFKTLREDWPDMAEAVEAYIKAQLENTRSSVEELVSSKVAPLAENIASNVSNTHFAKIQQAHPDVLDIVNSGELDMWQQSLKPWEQRGVQIVREYGSADEVVQLLNEYKATKSTAKKSSAKTTTPSSKQAEQTQTGIDYDILIEKLKAATLVPSSKSTPNTSSARITPNKDDFDAAFDEATKND